jgi:putative chitinase
VTDIFDFAGCAQYAQPLRDACAKWGVDGASVPYFLAQLSVESMKFSRVTENLNYRSDTLLRVCNGRNGIHTIDDATAVVMRGHDAIAEALYGGSWGASHLGNTEPGDGARFCGHGLIQTTGRYNHHVVSQRVHGDDRYLENPALLTLAGEAAEAAASFWMGKKLNGVTDVEAITHAINGGQEGLMARQAMTQHLLTYNP